jgi:RND family efflux transporter MFP subunit
MNHAQAMLDYTKILAPFDGTVIRRGVDTGQLTIAGPQGKPLFEVVRVEKVTAVLMFPETSAQLVAEGIPAEIRFPSSRNRALKGTVTRIARAVDPVNGTSRVEVDLPNPDGSLNPGLYLRATVVVEEHADTITVPATAVIRNGSEAFVACVESGKLVRKPIELGIEEGTRAEVLKGLAGTESVIKENGSALAVGQSVEIQVAAQSAKSAGSP